MNKLTIVAATAIATSLAAAPVMAAQDNTPSHKAMKMQKPHQANKQARMQMRDRSADASYQRGFNRGVQQRANADRRADFERGYGRSTTTYYDPDYAYNGYTTSGYNDGSYNSGFWPADIAADAVTGAVTTAGAIATAPFRDTYAYDNGYTPAPVYRSNVSSGWDNGWNNNAWDNSWNNNWARRQSVQEGGFACTPGSYYTNSYGYTQLCQ